MEKSACLLCLIYTIMKPVECPRKNHEKFPQEDHKTASGPINDPKLALNIVDPPYIQLCSEAFIMKSDQCSMNYLTNHTLKINLAA